VVRLLGQLLRTARQVGETLVFEASGEALWARVRSRFEDMLERYWRAGALRGASAAEAFSVNCDRSVMSQNDLDNGRVIVLVSFAPQLPVERIRVSLSLAEDGSVNLADADQLSEATP
jgi:phage tail sheath protein FI